MRPFFEVAICDLKAVTGTPAKNRTTLRSVTVSDDQYLSELRVAQVGTPARICAWTPTFGGSDADLLHHRGVLKLVGVGGFEPPLRRPERRVLPSYTTPRIGSR